MRLKSKKICLISTIIVYCASFLIQSNLLFFETWAREVNVPHVNIVAILVDNKIYWWISSWLEWYASEYVQTHLSDTKALVIPLDLEEINAYDIYRMLENVYFDWLKDVNSTLIWLIMFWNIPLPVVNQEWYIFPTVFPYVDFENQKYIYDPDSKYFIPNWNPKWQAEIWHWLIDYWEDIDAYADFFKKIKKYTASPDDFIWDSFWYEDFISQKKWFIDEKFPYYKNRIMFGEDLWYQRHSPLMKSIFRWTQNNDAIDLIDELEEYSTVHYEWRDVLEDLKTDWVDWLHTTKMVQQEIETSFIADYNDLFSKPNLSAMRENVFAWWRWNKVYENADWAKRLIADSDSSASKIQLKDELYLWNDDMEWMIQNLNDLLEEMVDRKVEEKHYSMDIVIPLSYQKTTWKRVRHRCYSFVDKFENFYFWNNARFIDNAEDLSIYRWTYRNLLSLDDVTYESLLEWNNPIKSKYEETNLRLKSVWWSYDIFSNQAEWNRWFTMVKVEDDLDIYDAEKVAEEEREYYKIQPGVYRMEWFKFCDDDDDDLYCEKLPDFAKRWWWWASSINLDASEGISRYYLKDYTADSSWRPIYAMDWFQSLKPWEDEWPNWRWWVDWRWVGPQWAATSYKAFEKYSSPTLKETWWWDHRWFFSWYYVVYSMHEPTIHTDFTNLNYWDLPEGVVRWRNATIESPKIFHLWKKNSGRILRCWKAWDYGYKVISSIVKHKATTDDQINWITRDRYWENGTLTKYYRDVEKAYEDLQFDIDDIIESFSWLTADIESGNKYMLEQLDDLQWELAKLVEINEAVAALSWELSQLESDLEAAEALPEEIKESIEKQEEILSWYNDAYDKFMEDLEVFEGTWSTTGTIALLTWNLESLNEEYEKLLNDDDADVADIKALERKIKKLEKELEEEMKKYEKLKDDIKDLEDDIKDIDKVIGDLKKDLGDAESVDTSAIEQGIANKKGEIEQKWKERQAVQDNIKEILRKIAEIVKTENKELEDVYKIIMWLFPQNIANVLDFIIYLEGWNPDEYHPELWWAWGAIKILFTSEWINIIKNIDKDIKDKTKEIEKAYLYIYDLIKDQQDIWDELSEKLKDENSEYIDDIEKIDEEMDGIFKLFKESCEDPEDDEDYWEYVGYRISDEPYDESQEEGECQVTLDRNTAQKWMQEFLEQLWISDKVFDNSVAIDTVWPAIVEAAQHDRDFIRWMIQNGVDYQNFDDNDWINNYAQWAKWPWYDTQWARANHDLLIWISEHLSWMNILTPDRPIDSPRYISMQSVAWNEIKLIYPDLFKVEAFYIKWNVHKIYDTDGMKESLIRYLEWKVEEYNKILWDECAAAKSFDPWYRRLKSLWYVLATPDTAVHSCWDFFTYDDFVDALWWEEMIKNIADILFYQNLNITAKKSSNIVDKDLFYQKRYFNVNDKREQTLYDYLILWMNKVKSTIFAIPTYEIYWYEAAYVNSDWRDYILPSEEDSPLPAMAEAVRLDNLWKNETIKINRYQATKQEENLDDECKIPANWRLPLFELHWTSVSSPWYEWFKCWLKKTLEEPIKIKITFDESLWEILSGKSMWDFISNLKTSEYGQAFTAWGDAWSEYADAWDTIINPDTEFDADKKITEVEVEAEKHNREATRWEDWFSNAVSNVANNVKVQNSNALITDSNPYSELRIESIADIWNITVEFIWVWDDSCLDVDWNVICDGGSFSKTFNPKTNPFTWLVTTSNHIAWKIWLDIKINGWGWYIEKVVKYTVSPSVLDRFELTIEDNKTIGWMISPVVVTWYDKYNNVVSWWLEKYDFLVTKWRFLKDWAYVDSFTTNDFRDLKFYYQAPLDAVDWEEVVFQIVESEKENPSWVTKYMLSKTHPLAQWFPLIKLNWKTVCGETLVDYAEYRLNSDESIYDASWKLDVSKLQRIDIYMRDLQWNIIDLDSQILVTSQNWLVVLWQLQQDEKWDDIFFQTPKTYMKDWIVTLYFYPTTVAWEDIINIDVPWLDTRSLHYTIKPAPLDQVQIVPENEEYLYLWEYEDIELFLSDVYWNLVDQPYTVTLTFDDGKMYFVEYPDAEWTVDIPVNDWYRKLKIRWIWAWLCFIISDNSFIEFNVDKHILPQAWLNILYFNYFGNDWWNQWWYFSDNNKNVEYIMTNSKKIITTTTQLVSEDKIKKIVWKIQPWLKFWNPDSVETMLLMQSWKINVKIWWITEMSVRNPWFTWKTIDSEDLDEFVRRLDNTSSNYALFVPSDPKYSVRNWILYSSWDYVANILDSWITFKLTSTTLENDDNVWSVIKKWTDYWYLILHYPDFKPEIDDFNIPGERYLINSVFTHWSTDDFDSVWIFDWMSQFELETSYKSIQNSDEILEQIWFLWDFKNITLFAEWEIVWEATKKNWSEFVINLWDPVLSKKGKNQNVYWTDFDWWIWQEVYLDTENEIFWTYEIDFNNDWLKDLLIVYLDWTVKLSKNYWWNPDLRKMQDLLRIAVPIKELHVWDADGNGYEDIIIITQNNQIRAYLNDWGIFDVDWSLWCINQNVFEWEISHFPSSLESIHQIFIEDMDQDGFTDIVVYDNMWYIKVFYWWSTNWAPNYLSTDPYSCDDDWYSREISNTTIVDALGLKVSSDVVNDNSMLHWVWMEKWDIEIDEDMLEDLWIKFDPYALEWMTKPRKRRVDWSLSEALMEVMDKDKFNVKKAGGNFAYGHTKIQDVTLYENELVWWWHWNNYAFAPSSFLDPEDEDDIGSTWKNFYLKKWWDILMNGDIVTVRVTVKASDTYPFQWAFWDIIQWPRKLYYDEDNMFQWIRFIQNQRGAYELPRDWIFSFLIDNITLNPWEEMIFEYDLEYNQIPLRDISISYKSFWSKDQLPDIKMQSIDWCSKNFDAYVNWWRTFKKDEIPLQQMIEDIYEDEDEQTEDYAEDVMSVWSNVNALPWIVEDRIARIKLLWWWSSDADVIRDWIMWWFEELGVNLTMDLSVFDEQLWAIEDIVDDITKWMCNWFKFWWSNNCKWLPVPFNQAFLAPGKYHLFGCRELPLGPLEWWLPVFFFPGTLYVMWIPIPFPWWLKSPKDDFIWAPWWEYPSMIRIYAAPTLTAQLWMAVCLWPYMSEHILPSPFADVAWNCIVFAVAPQCKSWWDDGSGGDGSDWASDNPNESYEPILEEVRDSWVCLQTEKWPEVLVKWNRSTPFDLYSFSSSYHRVDDSREWSRNPIINARDWLKENVDVNWWMSNWVEYQSSFLWIIELETNSYIWLDEDFVDNTRNSITIWDTEIEWWKYSINRIRWWVQQWIRKLLVDKWLDPQIRYIANQLTKMHVNIRLPDMSRLIDDEIEVMDNLTKNIWTIRKSNDELDEEDRVDPLTSWSSINRKNLKNFNKMIANPFEGLASLLNESNIINITTRKMNIKIPIIFKEDIDSYEIYLMQWLDRNEEILEEWENMAEPFMTRCDNIDTSTEKWKKEQEECYQKARDNLASFVKFKQSEWPKFQNQIYANLLVLQEYRNFPFEIYEWIHVIDRYMSELAALINNTIWYLSFWLSTNSQRFVWYVDAIVLIINVIKTYQLIIDFSVEWWQNCWNCARDTYDQYSCKLALLCEAIQLPIIQIPNFKLPNITIDLTNMDLWLDIVLPEFNFQPIRIDLPDLPNLPEPPSVSVDIKLLDLPNIPLLPEPPELPELPSFIPQVKMELPLLPPAPELPQIPNEIEVLIKAAKLIWKIYCIVKWKFWLVWESSVKAKIEQLTQRTYEVEWIDQLMDFTNLSVGPIKNYWVDYEISSYVDLQFDFTTFYDYLNILTKWINNLTTSSTKFVNDKMREWLDEMMGPIIEWVDAVENLDLNVNATLVDLDKSNWNQWLIGMADSSSVNNFDLQWLTTDEIEYVDYESAKNRLEDVLAFFKQETLNTSLSDTVGKSIDKMENQIRRDNNIVPNKDWLDNVKKEVLAYLDSQKSKYDQLADLINDDYDWFLAMVDSQVEQDILWEDSGKMLTFNVQLYNVDWTTKETIKNIANANPIESLVSNKKTIIDWYWNAINSNTADDLWLSDSQYLVLRNNIRDIRNQVTTMYNVTKPESSTKLIAKNWDIWWDKTLLADGWARLWSNMKVARQVDPSIFTDWIYEEMTAWGDAWKFTKVVFADSFASDIGNKYYHAQPSNDIILWDKDSVYRKCVWQNCHTAWWMFSKYYHSSVVSEIPYEETWLSFDWDTKLKIADYKEEVKWWDVWRQTSNIVTFYWKNSNADAYLIKLVERIDNSYEKEDYTNSRTPVSYILALPEWTELEELYDNWTEVELLNNEFGKIEDFDWDEIIEIVYFDSNKDKFDVVVSNLDRKWYYSRIAKLYLQWNVYTIDSPWSNQVTAWIQMVWDDQPPSWEAVLVRTSVPEITSRWDDLQAYVWTRYRLDIDWEDNVALSYINITKDGKLIKEKYTNKTGDRISIDKIDIHTESEVETYKSLWIDQLWNRMEKVITISYYVPDIKITNVSSDWGSAVVTAELSQDIDQWNVSFQKRRWEVWKTINEDIPIWVWVRTVLWGPYSIGNSIALYDKNWEVMALMSPDTAEINLQGNYEMKASVWWWGGWWGWGWWWGGWGWNWWWTSLQLVDKDSQNTIFNIKIPAEACVKIEADNYSIADLPLDWDMDIYNGWKVVYKDGDNVLFISPTCDLYSEIWLEWTYDYDRELDAVLLTLYQLSDLSKSYPIKVWLKAEPFLWK